MLKHFVVLYWNAENMTSKPLGFVCKAKNYASAEEQFFNAHPDSYLGFIYPTSNIEIALDCYLNR